MVILLYPTALRYGLDEGGIAFIQWLEHSVLQTISDQLTYPFSSEFSYKLRGIFLANP